MFVLRCYYVLVLFFADTLFSVNSLAISSRYRGDCIALHMPRGTVRLRQRRRFASFQCHSGYQLLGQKYSSCVNHKWDSPVPACIKLGCPPLPPIVNGLQYSTHGGAAVMYFCDPDFKLYGSQVIFCDGKHWNSTQPTCVGISAQESPPLSCDFESQDLCYWTQDETTNTEWYRLSKKTPSGVFGTGPSYDHTKGIGYNGHYMYIESSISRSDNQPARLISPTYRSNLTTDGCLDFYYHMYGRHTGTLRVIMKPENIDLKLILTDRRLSETYILFEKSGNQGDYWLHQTISLNEIEMNFQIIFEGSRGSGFLGDIAIDDVSILQGAQCISKLESTTTGWITEPIGLESCQNRCNAGSSPQSPDDCQCYDGCLENNNCCSDYQDICLFSTTAEDTYDTSTYSSTLIKRGPTRHPMLPPSLKMTAREKINDSNDNIPESTRQHAEPQTLTPKTTKILPTLNTTIIPITLTTNTTSKAISSTTLKIYPAPRRIITIPTTLKTRPKPPTTITLTTRTTFPQIHFLTPKQLYNATGRINRGPVKNISIPERKKLYPFERTPTYNKSLTRSTQSVPTLPKIHTLKPITKKLFQFLTMPQNPATSTKPPKVTPAVLNYSRTFENYHEFVHRKTLKDDVETVLKSKEPFQKSMAIKDGAVQVKSNGKNSPGTAAAAVTIPLLVLILVILEVTKRGRNSVFRKIHHKTIGMWENRRRHGQPSEVRYLTREEEVDLD